MLVAVGVIDLSTVIEEAPEKLGQGTYLFAGAMGLLELGSILGVPAPFEVGVVLSGAVAGQGEILLLPLVILTWACAVVGASINFATGRRLGRPFLIERGARFNVTPERLAKVEHHFERRGGATVTFANVIPFARSLTPFVAGSCLMPYRRFLAFSMSGTLLWAALFCGLGYAFYRSADEVADRASQIGLALAALLTVAGVLVYLRRRGKPATSGR